MKGKVYLHSIHKYKKAHKHNICIARKKMEGLYYMPILAPNGKLFSWYYNMKKSNSLYEGWFEDYRKMYLHQIKNSPRALDYLHKLKLILEKGEDVYFYCYCLDYKYCHRKIIGDLFKAKGFEVIYA